MPELFIYVINMSITASYVILAMLVLRLLLRRVPKWVTVALWAVAAIRLVCPFSFESVFSFIPSAQVVSPDIMMDKAPAIDLGISFLNVPINQIIGDSFIPAIGDSMNPLQLWIPGFSTVWVLGMLVLFAYTLISYLKLKRTVATAVLYKENIYQSEYVASPFVFGVVNPRIYLPFHISKKDMPHVISHEQAHLLRKDYLWKPVGFLLVIIHWFNPFVWLGYGLFCRDLELACDEKAIKLLDCGERADYSEALLNCSANSRRIGACPLAFGEVCVKKRIQSVLNYKKPAFWMILLAVVLSLVLAFGFLTNPVSKENTGVTDLSVSKVNADTLNLNLGYSIPTGGYVVRCVPQSEGEYCGDGMINYDGALGKYRIYISFGDTDLSVQMEEKYPGGQAIELQNAPVPMRVKVVRPEGHGFGLYVGFDTPIDVQETVVRELNLIGGWITIPITLLAVS